MMENSFVNNISAIQQTNSFLLKCKVYCYSERGEVDVTLTGISTCVKLH